MKENFDRWLSEVLKHEGGFVDHPKDPGGATNKGITIGTLKRLGIDVDGDGDSDIADLKKLRHSDVARVYRLFYWDAVRGDILPSGLDFCIADFAVNSGVSRAVQHLQRALGVVADGDLGPKTMAAIEGADVADLINRVCDSRLAFLKRLKTWGTFGKGWSRRVSDVRAVSLAHVGKVAAKPTNAPVTQAEKAEPKAEQQAPEMKLIPLLFAAIAAAAAGAWAYIQGLLQ